MGLGLFFLGNCKYKDNVEILDGLLCNIVTQTTWGTWL